MKIVVVGSINTDMIVKIPRIPKPGETILGGKFSTAAGGKGANQAVAAARVGGDVTFIARVGNDIFGKQALEGFESNNINTKYIKMDSTEPSGVALIFVDEKGENSIAVASGANSKLTPGDVTEAEEVIKSADVLLMQLETPMGSIKRIAKIAKEAGVKVILDPAPARPLDNALLSTLYIITPNESEAELLTDIPVTDFPSAEKAAFILLDRGVEVAIITMGSKGALIKTRELTKIVPGFKVNAVDSTAAGDVFNGSLVVAMAEGKTLEKTVQFANAAAALSVTKLGAQPSAPKRVEIERMLLNQS
jgi:ribokinase|tara:strand:+ start:7751 stop:8668 length:918 start_codon:yes stop_codon:yes gene_type:complete